MPVPPTLRGIRQVALMAPVTRGSLGDSGGRERALPRVRGPAVAADPPSPRPRSNLTPIGRLAARRVPGAREEWALVPPRLPQAQAHAQAFLDRVEEETGILRAAG